MSLERIAYEGEAFTVEWYYDSKEHCQALDYFSALSEQQQDRALYLFKRMGDHGLINDKTKFRHEGDQIYAFKPQPDRFLCFFLKGKKIMVTNAFCKKQDKLPPKEKQKAIGCKTDYETRIKEKTYYD